MNPESTDTPEISASVTSLMKSSGSLLEGAEVKNENGKTIIKPKKKITLKEFLASQPYKFTIDNSVVQPKSAPCNYRSHTYSVFDKFAPYPGKTIAGFMASSSYISWYDLKNKYGFSQLFVHPADYQFALNSGWTNDQIIIRLPYHYVDSLESIQTINSSNNYSSFYIDEPIERVKCNGSINQEQLYVISMARLASPRPVVMGSYLINGNSYFCDIVYHYDNFTTHYDYIFGNTSNTYIMCDEYKKSGSSMQNHWSAYKSNWPSKNLSNFMDIGYQQPGGNYPDYAHWDGLFPHARNTLGLNSICLYSNAALIQSNDLSKINSFCQYAFQNYFLRGFNRNVIITEICTSPECEHCQDPENPEGVQYWFVDQIIYSNFWWEVFP